MELEALKPGSTLINAGRARLVQEDALMNVLRRGEIRAMLDVFYQEPLPPDHELFRLPNVFCTPHDAGTPGMRQYAAFMFASFDPVAIDQACCDAVNRQIPQKGSTIEGKEGDPLSAAHPVTDWRGQIVHGKKIGLGTDEYELIRI